MSGKELVLLLSFYNLSFGAAADLLGVHPSTVYRWIPQKKIAAERMQLEILSVLEHIMKMNDSADLGEPKYALRQFVQLRGGLYGLYVLLRRFFKEDATCRLKSRSTSTKRRK